MRRVASIVLAALALGWLPAEPPATAGAVCTARLLVLSAMPTELDPLLARATVRRTVVIDGRSFFVGRLGGNDVVMALSGIGLVNAGRTTRTAFRHFRCGAASAISGVVFSGVSGGEWIGDVTVPSHWIQYRRQRSLHVDPTMLATARAVARSGRVKLARATPAGDPACTGQDPDLVRTVSVQHTPRIVVGGEGMSSDPFGGRAFPCFPGGGDVFGCEPCRRQSRQLPDVARFAKGAAPFLDPNFFLSYFREPSPPPGHSVAQDMETAAVARVAARGGVPFIAFRAVSDGKGDPLMLPGFPFQFFVYRQLAADNAAATTLAFLRAWAART